MVDHSDDPRPKPIRRIEVITGGGGRRRRWGEDEKARIVAESFAPGAVVAEVARRHDTRAQQVHGWRRDAREGRLVLPAEKRANALVNFAPVVVAPRSLPSTKAAARGARPAAAMIEIEAKGIVVRVQGGADVLLVEAMLRVLRARA
jgi:transposase